MRESQAEIKAIEAQLRSIRVEPSSSQRVPSTLLEPRVPHSQSRNSTVLNHSPQMRQGKNSTAQKSTTQKSTTQKSMAPDRATQNSAVQNSAVQNRRSAEDFPQANSSQVKPSQTRPAQINPSQAPPAQTKRVEGYPLPPKHRLPNHLEATVNRLQEQSAFYVEQFRQLQSPSFQTPAQLFEQTLKLLDAQAQHINQLSTVQESALLELKTIAEQVEQEWKTLEHSQDQYAEYAHYSESELDISPICEYLGTAVPQVEKNKDGIYVLSARSIDLFKAEREAALTAQSLRHWANRRNPAEAQSQSTPPAIWQWLTRWLSPAEVNHPDSARATPDSRAVDRTATRSPSQTPAPKSHSPSPRRARSRQHRPVSRSVLRLKEAVALFLGAVIVRVVLDMVLASFPVLWTPAIALLVTPAAIAVYRSSNTPQAGLVWGYRLLIIMIGLLIGARL